MARFNRQLTSLCVALCLAAGVNTAEAAKGVKKTGQHLVTGHVVSVQHKSGTGMFRVRTAKHHKKLAATTAGTTASTVAATGTSHHIHEFQATPATKITGPGGTPATMAALHRGERVRVAALGKQAQSVQVLSVPRVAGVVRRHPRRSRAIGAAIPMGIARATAAAAGSQAAAPKPNATPKQTAAPKPIHAAAAQAKAVAKPIKPASGQHVAAMKHPVAMKHPAVKRK